MQNNAQNQTLCGVGVGLRGPHVPAILKNKPDVPWFELLTDNHLTEGGVFSFQAEAISELYPVALHGVGMSLGATSPIDWDYVRAVKELTENTNAVHISDHLSFSGYEKVHSHELLPLPKTEEALYHVADRLRQVQDFLGQRILIENVSTYLEFEGEEFSDTEFITELCKLADCNLLLDVNNVYVNAVNHDHHAAQVLEQMPWERVREIHVAGHEDSGDLILDTHGGPVCDEVLELLKIAVQHVPDAPVLLEWDTDLPEWDVVLTEAQRIEKARKAVHVKELNYA